MVKLRVPARAGRKNKEATSSASRWKQSGACEDCPLLKSLFSLDLHPFLCGSSSHRVFSYSGLRLCLFAFFISSPSTSCEHSNEKLVSSWGKVILFDVTKAMSSWATSIQRTSPICSRTLMTLYPLHLLLTPLLTPPLTSCNPDSVDFFSPRVALSTARDDLATNKYRYYALMRMTQHLLSMDNVIRGKTS